MKRRNFFFMWGIVLSALFIMVLGCQDEEPTDPPEPIGTYSGQATASYNGYGGLVFVTITMKDGYITAVEIDGKNKTDDVGGRVIADAPASIIKSRNHPPRPSLPRNSPSDTTSMPGFSGQPSEAGITTKVCLGAMSSKAR